MQKPSLIALAILLLTGCVLESPQRNQSESIPTTPPEERSEEAAKTDIKELLVGTGALAERLLVTGIIDIGKREAPVTLILFTEHHARYAREFQQDLFPRLLKDFIEPGLVRFQVVILPLKKYPQSEPAAAGLLCAAMQGKGILMHTTLSELLDKERLEPRHYAEELELDLEEFDSCITGEEIQIILKQQRAWAQSLGVTLVPTFFLNGEKNVGLPYYADLRGMIEELI
ncbi:DsbA family protein [Patescibacteria group bacterium]|nr:DsbA family protein [Patescibacteria group bacterium]